MKQVLNIIGLVMTCLFLAFCERIHPTPEPDPEVARKEDSTSNAALMPGLGNFYMQKSYSASAKDIPLVAVILEGDSITYLGDTDAAGEITGFNAKVTSKKSNGRHYIMTLDREKKTVLLQDKDKDGTSSGLFLEIQNMNDSIAGVSGYKVVNGGKEHLFERLKIKKDNHYKNLRTSNAQGLAEAGVPGLITEFGDRVNSSLNGYSVDLALTEILMAIQNGQIKLKSEDEIALVELVETEESSFTSGKQLGVSMPEITIVEQPFRPGEILIKELSAIPDVFKFSLEKISGDNQTVIFGQKPEPVKVSVKYNGEIFPYGKVQAIAGIGDKSETWFLSADENGVVAVPLQTHVKDEATGLKEMSVVIKKLNVSYEESDITLRINLKPRPRIHLQYDSNSDGQTGGLDEMLPKPIKVQVVDEENKPVKGVTLAWYDNTYSKYTSGFEEHNTLTDENGISTNPFKLNEVLGQHNMEVAIVNFDAQGYAVSDDYETVKYVANAIKKCYEPPVVVSVEQICQSEGILLEVTFSDEDGGFNHAGTYHYAYEPYLYPVNLEFLYGGNWGTAANGYTPISTTGDLKNGTVVLMLFQQHGNCIPTPGYETKSTWFDEWRVSLTDECGNRSNYVNFDIIHYVP